MFQTGETFHECLRFFFPRFQSFLNFPFRGSTKVTDPGLGKGLSSFFPDDFAHCLTGGVFRGQLTYVSWVKDQQLVVDRADPVILDRLQLLRVLHGEVMDPGH